MTGGTVPRSPDPQVSEPAQRFGWADALAAARRYWRLILLGAVAGGCVALILALRLPAFYAATTTIRAERFSAAGGSPETVSGALATEVQLMRSRALAGHAVRALHLQVRATPVRGLIRDELVEPIGVDSVTPGEYTIGLTVAGRRVGVMDRRSRRLVAEVEPGDTLRFAGVTLVLRGPAANAMPFSLRVLSFDHAVDEVMKRMGAVQPSAGGGLVVLRYEDTDSALVSQVPNTIVERFLETRNVQLAAARQRTIDLLTIQRDTVAAQLAAAEQELLDYRRRTQAVNPGAASGTQVSRLVTLRTDRALLDGERQTLARLIERADRRAARSGGDGPSPYRELLGFPALLKSGAGGDLVAELAYAERERTAGASERDSTARHARRREIEARLRGIAATYLEGLASDVRSIDSNIAALDRQVAAVPRQEYDLARLERQPEVLRGVYELLEARLTQAELADSANPLVLRVVDPATPPQAPVRPVRWLLALGGAAAGLLVAAGVAVVRRVLNPAVRSRRDVTAAIGLPVLGVLPRVVLRDRALPLVAEAAPPRPLPAEPVPPPVVQVSALRRSAGAFTFFHSTDPAQAPEPATDRSEAPSTERKRVPAAQRCVRAARVARVVPTRAAQPMTEALATFQTNLVATRANPAARTLLLTSPLEGDGKTTCAVNLAVTLALRGLRVILLDADLRRGRVHEAFEAPAEPGLADVLAGQFRYTEVLHTLQVGEDGELDYLARGKVRFHPTGLLDSREMRVLLASLGSAYDAVILDSPPANMLTDAVVLGAMVDEVVIVARAGSTDGAALRYAREQLEYVRAPLIGVLLNAVDFVKDAAFDAAYRFHARSHDYLMPNRER